MKLKHDSPSAGVDPRALGCLCALCPFRGQTPVLPSKSKETKLIVLAESPGRVEEYEGRPLVGPTGQWFDECLDRFSISRGHLHLTNAVLCRPNKGATPKDWKQAVKCCKPRLVTEIKATKCKIVFALGKWALFATTTKGKIVPWVGAELPGVNEFEGYRILPALHPTFCRFYKDAFSPVFQIWLLRAWQLARGKLKRWKWPRIIIKPGPEMLEALTEIRDSNLHIGVDVETAGVDPLQANLLCLGVANKHVAVSVPWPLDLLPAAYRTLCRDILNGHQPKVMQNGQHDLLTMKHNGFHIKNFTFDTLLAHAVVAPQIPHDLGLIATIEFHAPRWKTEFGEETDLKGAEKFTKRDPLALRTYNAKDAWMTVMLEEPLQRRLESTHRGQEQFLEKMRLQQWAMRMRERGVPVLKQNMQRHRENLRSRRKTALGELRLIARQHGVEHLNPNSNAQLKDFFFNRLKVRPTRFSESTEQPSLDSKALEPLITDPNARIAASTRALLRYRRWSKLLQTYVDKLPLKKRKDGSFVVRPTWKIYGTITGRWSSQAPNLMNVPKPKYRTLKNGNRQLEAPGLRDLFGPHGNNWIVEADYSALEARIVALLAGDAELLEWFALHDAGKGEDVHRRHAKILFETDAPAERERELTKRDYYAWQYGADDETIWRSLVIEFHDLSLSQVAHMSRVYNKVRHKIVAWRDEQLLIATRNKYVEAPLSGRREYFYNFIEPSKVYNYPAQATGADLINPAFLALVKELKWPEEGVDAQVHDSLVADGPDPIRLMRLMKKHMEREVVLNGIKHKFPVEFKISNVSWGACEKVKDEADARKLIAAREAAMAASDPKVPTVAVG